MTVTTTAIRYRKTRQGEWVAFGPTAALGIGDVTVVKADGTCKTETVTRVGRSFHVDGVEMAYGYLAPRAHRNYRESGSYQRRARDYGPGRCAGCGAPAVMQASTAVTCHDCYDDFS